jgi:hypothetical protein
MATWHYSFFFPGTNQNLDATGSVDVLACFGLKFDNTVRLAVEIDEFGHLEHGEEEQLVGEVRAALKKRLSERQQFLIECRNDELVFSCSYATRYANPYIMLGWSKGMFRNLSESRQSEYWEMLVRCAKQCSAAYVIIVDDPPDFFEDRFLEIDGQRFLENEMPSGKKYDIRAIWIDFELCERVPLGIDASSRRELPFGFFRYSALE